MFLIIIYLHIKTYRISNFTDSNNYIISWIKNGKWYKDRVYKFFKSAHHKNVELEQYKVTNQNTVYHGNPLDFKRHHSG